MQDDHRLTSSTLQLLGSSKSRREDVVHSYISSLARFSRAHADEGRAVLNSWSAGACEQDRRPDPLIRESGFETPILKPRTAAVDNINDDSRGQGVSDIFTTRKLAHGIKSSREMKEPAFKLPLKSPLSNATQLDVALRTKNSLKLEKSTARGISKPKSLPLNRSSKKRFANDESDEDRAMSMLLAPSTITSLNLRSLKDWHREGNGNAQNELSSHRQHPTVLRSQTRKEFNRERARTQGRAFEKRRTRRRYPPALLSCMAFRQRMWVKTG